MMPTAALLLASAPIAYNGMLLQRGAVFPHQLLGLPLFSHFDARRSLFHANAEKLLRDMLSSAEDASRHASPPTETRTVRVRSLEPFEPDTLSAVLEPDGETLTVTAKPAHEGCTCQEKTIAQLTLPHTPTRPGDIEVTADGKDLLTISLPVKSKTNEPTPLKIVRKEPSVAKSKAAAPAALTAEEEEKVLNEKFRRVPHVKSDGAATASEATAETAEPSEKAAVDSEAPDA